MGREIELKFRLPDPASFRQRLREHGAQFFRQDFEVNRIFDTAARTLAAQGSVLRVREVTTDGNSVPARLTYKGPREKHAVKVREEIETTTDDGDNLRRILERLGYRETIRYEKRRETWLFSACEVTIDELPELGTFGEIEGPSIDQVREAQSTLEISAEQLVDESYIGLTVKHGSTDLDGVRTLFFAPDPSGGPPHKG